MTTRKLNWVGCLWLTAIACGEQSSPQSAAPPESNACAAEPENVVPGGGNFDSAVDGFAPGSWNAEDAQGCPGSGSLSVSSRSRSETFAVAPGRYKITFFAKNGSAATESGCDIDWCKSKTCGAGLVLRTFTLTAKEQRTDWTRVEDVLQAPDGTVAARLTCGAGGGAAAASFDGFAIVPTAL
jgi:hypothetical protein